MVISSCLIFSFYWPFNCWWKCLKFHLFLNLQLRKLHSTFFFFASFSTPYPLISPALTNDPHTHKGASTPTICQNPGSTSGDVFKYLEISCTFSWYLSHSSLGSRVYIVHDFLIQHKFQFDSTVQYPHKKRSTSLFSLIIPFDWW